MYSKTKEFRLGDKTNGSNKTNGLDKTNGSDRPKREHGLYSFFTADSETRKMYIEEVKKDEEHYTEVAESLKKDRSISSCGV